MYIWTMLTTNIDQGWKCTRSFISVEFGDVMCFCSMGKKRSYSWDIVFSKRHCYNTVVTSTFLKPKLGGQARFNINFDVTINNGYIEILKLKRAWSLWIKGRFIFVKLDSMWNLFTVRMVFCVLSNYIIITYACNFTTWEWNFFKNHLKKMSIFGSLDLSP